MKTLPTLNPAFNNSRQPVFPLRPAVFAFLLTTLLNTSPAEAEVNTHQRAATTAQEKRVLLSVDNTWFHRLGLSRFTYQRALRRAGLTPVVVNFKALTHDLDEEALAARLLRGMHGLVLAGGGDVDPALFGEEPAFSLGVNPERDRFELALLRYAEQEGVPVLAICRGHQLLNVARGGTLRNLRADKALAPVHKNRWRGHGVALEPNSRLARWLGLERIPQATSYHGQAIDTLGEGLTIVGMSDDGVVEAVESTAAVTNSPTVFGTVGVQWHPEVKTDAVQMRLFKAFANAVRSPRNEPVDFGLTQSAAPAD